MQTQRLNTELPYMEHLFQGYLLLTAYPHMLPDSEGNANALAGALLRSTLFYHSDSVTYEMLHGKFGEEVAMIVRDLTPACIKAPDEVILCRHIAACDWKRQIVKMVQIIMETDAIRAAVNRVGLVKTQEFFPRPLLDWIEIRRQFLCDCQLGQYSHLNHMRDQTKLSLDILECAIEGPIVEGIF